MRYKCGSCEYIGEQMNFLKPVVMNNEFRYDTKCPHCGSDDRGIEMVVENMSDADSCADDEVVKILQDAMATINSISGAETMLLTQEELERICE